MVLKATNNRSQAVQAVRAKDAGRRTQKQGSHVTEERAKAQRTKLDAQADARQTEEEKEAITPQTPKNKIGRQEIQAKRRALETLIEAYIQDHIGGYRAMLIQVTSGIADLLRIDLSCTRHICSPVPYFTRRSPIDLHAAPVNRSVGIPIS